MSSVKLDSGLAGQLSERLRLDASDPLRVLARESNDLEMKESFGWRSREKYVRTMAAFANRRGGFIAFGISDSPRRVIGLSDEAVECFDPSNLSTLLGSSLSPMLVFAVDQLMVGDKTVGLIYTAECENKPVICMRNGENLKDGEVYYRYGAQNRLIRQPEMAAIIQREKEKERERWLHLIRRMASIGSSNVALLDTITGEVTGSGGTFLIDDQLLKKVEFVREGQFCETDGKPTLRLIGDVQPIESHLIRPTRQVSTPRFISSTDIMSAFLMQEHVQSPVEYIRRICYTESGYLPVYYFAVIAGMSRGRLIGLVEREPSRHQARKTLLKRLQSGDRFEPGNLSSETTAALEKRQMLQAIGEQLVDVDTMDAARLKRLLQAVQLVSPEEIVPPYLYPILHRLATDKYQSLDSSTAGELRKSVCYLDSVRYSASLS